MARRKRRTFDEDFKREAVRLITTGGRSCNSVAKDLGVSQTTLQYWKLQYLGEMPEMAKKPKTTDSDPNPYMERIKQLEKELRDAKEDNAILKKAMAIFSSKSE